MSGTFILSFDCEGKWGVADHLSDEHLSLSQNHLWRAYEDIVALLDRHGMPATFAFVGLFSLPQCEIEQLDLDRLAARLPYFQKALNALQDSIDGWIGDWALALVQSAAAPHEIALHGMTHTPWDEMNEGEARLEMSLITRLPFRPNTFIYPRNAVRHVEVLADHGLAGYRAVRPRPGRLESLLSEFDLFAKPEHAALGRPIPIPAGYFVNWRHGPRKAVPISISRLRAKQLLRHAAKHGGVVHFWTHPENIASAPGTLQVLQAVVEEVARSRDRGEIVVQTQLEFCQLVSARAPSSGLQVG